MNKRIYKKHRDITQDSFLAILMQTKVSKARRYRIRLRKRSPKELEAHQILADEAISKLGELFKNAPKLPELSPDLFGMDSNYPEFKLIKNSNDINLEELEKKLNDIEQKEI